MDLLERIVKPDPNCSIPQKPKTKNPLNEKSEEEQILIIHRSYMNHFGGKTKRPTISCFASYYDLNTGQICNIGHGHKTVISITAKHESYEARHFKILAQLGIEPSYKK